MTKNILLDTNILRKLISPTEFSPYLRQIVEWEEQGHIRLFCPATLKKEWEKHRAIEFKRVKDILKNHEATLKASELFDLTPDIGEPKLLAAEKRLWAQVQALDTLMETAIAPKEDKGVVRMWKHKNEKKAPFRVKEKSENDAVILFSTLEEIMEMEESELYFLSTNHTEYAALGNIENIHADISEAFPSVRIIYFTDVAPGINVLAELGLPTNRKKIDSGKIQVPNIIPVDRNKSGFDQLYDYLDKRFSDIDFLPKNLFSYHFPIIGGDSYQERREAFTISTDNEALFSSLSEKFRDLEQFRSLNETESAEVQVVDELISCLRNNLVYTIRYNHRMILEVPLTNGAECNCAVCTYNEGRLDTSFSMLKGGEEEPASLKKAYIFYLHGMWIQAVAILKEVSDYAESHQKWLTYYIANYNLLLLGRLSRIHPLDGAVHNDVFAELRDIDMDSVLEICKSPSNNKILEMLHYSRFQNRASEEMQGIVSKIKNSQIDQDRGWSDDTNNMFDLFFETIYFMERNYIMIDEYSDVSRFTEYFLDGLFASYQCSETLTGKIKHLSDPIISKIIDYANADKILKYKRRYGIKKMKYIRNVGGSAFVLKGVKIIKSYQYLIDLFENRAYDRRASVWLKYRRIILNTLTMTSVVEMKADEVEAVSEELLSFLQIQNHIQEYELSNALASFLKSNVQLMTDQTLEKFLHLAFTGQGFDRERILNVLSTLGKERGIAVHFTDSEWQLLSSYFLESNSMEKIAEICNLYIFSCDESKKEELVASIQKSLLENFNGRVYYMAVMAGMLQPCEEFNAVYELEIVQIACEGRQARIFEGETYNDFRADEFINLSFLLERPLSAQVIACLTRLDDYYAWIGNIDSFDYEKFQPDWLYNHLTIYYKNHFRNSLNLRKKIRSEIMNTTDFRLAQLYLDLYEVNVE